MKDTHKHVRRLAQLVGGTREVPDIRLCLGNVHMLGDSHVDGTGQCTGTACRAPTGAGDVCRNDRLESLPHKTLSRHSRVECDRGDW